MSAIIVNVITPEKIGVTVAAGPKGDQGIQGPAGPSTPSTDEGNLLETGSDDLLYLDAGNILPEAIGAEPTQTPASQAEAEAGTEAGIRSFSPLRVAQAIAAQAVMPGTKAALESVQFDTVSPPDPLILGETAWDAEEKTLRTQLMDGVTLQHGQEIHFHVTNGTAQTIADGTLVMSTGTQGNTGKILVAPWDGVTASKHILGVVTMEITAGSDGYVTYFGKVRQIDTRGLADGGWVDGTVLFADPDHPGKLTKTLPQAPKGKTTVAIVIRAGTNGSMFVRITYGSMLGEDELVQLGTLQNNDSLYFNSTTGRFENKTPAQARAALSLGNAATKSVGTTSVTVAAGDAPQAAVDAHVEDEDPHSQYVQKITGKGLSSEDYTSGDKAKLAGIEAGADVTSAQNVGSVIEAAPEKTVPIDTDEIAGLDSASGETLVRFTFASLWDWIVAKITTSAAMIRTALGLGNSATRNVGTTSGTVAAGNDTRFSDARDPTAHRLSHEPGGSDALTVDAPAVVGSLRTLGTGSRQAVAGNDSRLSNARTPTAHQSTHRAGGSDPLPMATEVLAGLIILAENNESSATKALKANDIRLPSREGAALATGLADGSITIQDVMYQEVECGFPSSEYGSIIECGSPASSMLITINGGMYGD